MRYSHEPADPTFVFRELAASSLKSGIFRVLPASLWPPLILVYELLLLFWTKKSELPAKMDYYASIHSESFTPSEFSWNSPEDVCPSSASTWAHQNQVNTEAVTAETSCQ